MSDAPEPSLPPGPSGGGSGSHGRTPQGGRSAAGSGGSANRSRNRNRSRGNRNGNRSQSGLPAGGARARAGGQPAGRAGPRASRAGGSGSRGGSGNRPSGRSSGAGDALAVPVVGPVSRVVDRQAEGNEEASAVRANRRRARVICAAPGVASGLVVGLVLVAVGLPLIGAVALVVIAAAVSLGLWRLAPRTVARSVGALPSDEWEHPRLHNLVDGLCATMGLTRPTVCVVDSPVPNAMAVGRDPASALLVVTSGLDESLTLVELEGVLAHELVHIKRHDTVAAALAVVVAVPWALVAGTATGADAVHSLIGRGREFSADQRAAGVVRYPPGIGSALVYMAGRPNPEPRWPPGTGRTAALTRWLWIDPMAGAPPGDPEEGNLDDTRVRAAAQSLV